MPIHTGTQGALDVFRKDAGGQCENGDAGGVFTGQRTDGPGRVKAIHDRHLYIHEDRGVFPRSGTLKQVHGHLAVLGVLVDLLDQLLAALLRQLGEAQPDAGAVVLGVD